MITLNISGNLEFYQLIVDTVPYMNGWVCSLLSSDDPNFGGIPTLIQLNYATRTIREVAEVDPKLDVIHVNSVASLSRRLEVIDAIAQANGNTNLPLRPIYDFNANLPSRPMKIKMSNPKLVEFVLDFFEKGQDKIVKSADIDIINKYCKTFSTASKFKKDYTNEYENDFNCVIPSMTPHVKHYYN